MPEGASTSRLSGPAWGSRRCASGSRGWEGRSRCGAVRMRARRSGSRFLWRVILQVVDVYNAPFDGVDHRLRPVEDVQLPVDVGRVVSDRLLRDAQRVGDLAVRHAPGQGFYHLELTLGKRRDGGVRASPRTRALERPEHLLGEVGSDDGVPRVDRVDGAREVLGLRVL